MDFPPLYKDLGKAAKDLFSKGFCFGAVKLDVRSKSESGFEVRAAGSNNTDTGMSGGHLETRYKLRDLGLSLKHGWNTENRLTVEATSEDRLARGLRLGLDASFVPNTGKKTAALKVGFRGAHVNASCAVDLEPTATAGSGASGLAAAIAAAAVAPARVHADGVLGYQGVLAGYQMTFDPATSQLTHSSAAVGYRARDFQLLATVQDGAEFNTSVYQRVNERLETAAGMTWTLGSDSSRLGIAAKYRVDESVTLAGKVDNACLVGLGYTQTLRPGVKFTVSALIDGKNVNAGGHKVGMGFEFEA